MTFGAFVTLLVTCAFAALFYWVLRPRNKARLQSYASIPFDDEPPRREEPRRPEEPRRLEEPRP
ncbi:MAG TPA: cbb3-type cytochrome c oxidase subunit 3 [Pseudomonadales bacterium]